MENELKNKLESKIFFAGIALSNSVNYDSSIAILDKSKKIILLDKFYNTDDLELFLKNYMSAKDTVFCVSIPSDSTMLEGKWRIHSKNYKMLDENFEINKNNWTKRASERCCEVLIKHKEEGIEIFRYDIAQLRLAYGLEANYTARSSLDCKSLQTALKLKYDFRQLPDNMLPASNFEAILGAMFAYDIAGGKRAKNVGKLFGIDILYKSI